MTKSPAKYKTNLKTKMYRIESVEQFHYSSKFFGMVINQIGAQASTQAYQQVQKQHDQLLNQLINQIRDQLLDQLKDQYVSD